MRAFARPIRGSGVLLALASLAQVTCAPGEPVDGLGPHNPRLVSISVTPDSTAVPIGQTQIFQALGGFSDGSTAAANVTWTSTGGTISNGGMYTAGSTAGTYRVIAVGDSGLADTSKVTIPPVSPPPPPTLVSIAVTPPSAAILPGGTQQFAVSGTMSDGNVVVPAVTWTATGGTVTGTGLYTAGTTDGGFRVIARTSGGLADTAAVTITLPPATLVAVELTPESASLQSGQTQQFTAIGRLSNGTTSPVAITWSSTGGSINASGVYTAGASAGTFRVIASSANGLADTSTVTISAPTVTVITVTPASATVLSGQTRQFTAVATLSNGGTQNNPSVTWTATGGSVNTSGLYTAGATAGTFRVIATSPAGPADTSAVTIPAATVTAISVTPASATVSSGQTQQFTAVATLSNGGTQNNPSVTWTATGGTVNSSGLYTAGATAGTFRVIATAPSGPADTSAITIPAPTVTAITVTPASASVVSGQTRQFTAVATLSNGSTQNNPSVTWIATGGTISTSGLYTAGATIGTAFRVIATSANGVADTSAVTITVATPTLTSLSLTPVSVSLATGGTQQFSVAGTWSDGSTTIPTVTYTATGGTVTSGGLYTAGSSAGSYRVIASHVGGSITDTSAVTIPSTGGTTLFSEGFEDGNLGARGWFDNTSITTTADARPGSSGTRSLQWHWSPGSTTPQGASRRDFGPSTSVYMSYWVKHSTSWVGSGRNYHPHMFQIITTADDHFIGPSITHLTVYDELLYLNGNIKAQLAIQDALMINENNINVDLRGVTENRSIGGYNGQHEFDDATSTVMWDLYLYQPGQHTNYRLIRPKAVTITNASKNQWHHIETYWQMNSIVGGIGQQDGVLQYWVDGALTIDRHDVYFRTGANPNMRFSTLLLAPYIGDGSPVDQSIWIDDLTIGTAHP